MRHRRFRRGAVPVSFSRSDMHNITDGHISLFRFGCNLALPRRDNENLITIVHIKAGERHWHGATAETPMSHITVTTVGSTSKH